MTAILVAAIVACIVACILAQRPIILVSVLTLSVAAVCLLQGNRMNVKNLSRSEVITQHTVNALLRPR